MENGISVIFVIPIMIVIILISRNATSKAVLYTTLACVAAATLFFATVSAGGGDYGPILAVGGFIAAGAITYYLRGKHKKG
jgi:hypothetical protein